MFVDFQMTTPVIVALVAAPFLYVGSLALGRWLKRGHGVQLGSSFQLLCLFLALYVPLKAIHLNLHPADEPGRRYLSWGGDALNHFGAAIILLSVLFTLTLIRRFYWQRWFQHRHHAEAPKFLQQLFSFVVFCVVCAVVLKVGYRVEVDAFLAGSGIVAVVIGFAMQETLANIVSGIALQIGKPFKVGDWLIVDNIRAEVIEVNWRSTRLRTNDDIHLDIPNKTVVGSTITNLSFPTQAHAHRILIGFEYSAPPNIVREVLARAATNAHGVLTQPAPKIYLKSYGDSAIVYEIKYTLDDESRFNDIEDAIRTNVWYEAKRAGLIIPFPIRTLQIQRPKSPSNPALELARTLLPKQELFALLDDRQKEQLLSHATILRFGRGERVIRQGQEGSSMFILLYGEADVIIHANGQDTLVATVRSGDAFGEMCLLTGEARTASVVARNDCDIWEIRRNILQPILQDNAALAEKMSLQLAQRKLVTEGILAATAPSQMVVAKEKEYTAGFLKKISALFEI